jgi:hypothetical protein
MIKLPSGAVRASMSKIRPLYDLVGLFDVRVATASDVTIAIGQRDCEVELGH